MHFSTGGSRLLRGFTVIQVFQGELEFRPVVQQLVYVTPDYAYPARANPSHDSCGDVQTFCTNEAYLLIEGWMLNACALRRRRTTIYLARQPSPISHMLTGPMVGVGKKRHIFGSWGYLNRQHPFLDLPCGL